MSFNNKILTKNTVVLYFEPKVVGEAKLDKLLKQCIKDSIAKCRAAMPFPNVNTKFEMNYVMAKNGPTGKAVVYFADKGLYNIFLDKNPSGKFMNKRAFRVPSEMFILDKPTDVFFKDRLTKTEYEDVIKDLIRTSKADKSIKLTSDPATGVYYTIETTSNEISCRTAYKESSGKYYETSRLTQTLSVDSKQERIKEIRSMIDLEVPDDMITLLHAEKHESKWMSTDDKALELSDNLYKYMKRMGLEDPEDDLDMKLPSRSKHEDFWTWSKREKKLKKAARINQYQRNLPTKKTFLCLPSEILCVVPETGNKVIPDDHYDNILVSHSIPADISAKEIKSQYSLYVEHGRNIDCVFNDIVLSDTSPCVARNVYGVVLFHFLDSKEAMDTLNLFKSKRRPDGTTWKIDFLRTDYRKTLGCVKLTKAPNKTLVNPDFTGQIRGIHQEDKIKQKEDWLHDQAKKVSSINSGVVPNAVYISKRETYNIPKSKPKEHRAPGLDYFSANSEDIAREDRPGMRVLGKVSMGRRGTDVLALKKKNQEESDRLVAKELEILSVIRKTYQNNVGCLKDDIQELTEKMKSLDKKKKDQEEAVTQLTKNFNAWSKDTRLSTTKEELKKTCTQLTELDIERSRLIKIFNELTKKEEYKLLIEREDQINQNLISKLEFELVENKLMEMIQNTNAKIEYLEEEECQMEDKIEEEHNKIAAQALSVQLDDILEQQRMLEESRSTLFKLLESHRIEIQKKNELEEKEKELQLEYEQAEESKKINDESLEAQLIHVEEINKELEHAAERASELEEYSSVLTEDKAQLIESIEDIQNTSQEMHIIDTNVMFEIGKSDQKSKTRRRTRWKPLIEIGKPQQTRFGEEDFLKSEGGNSTEYDMLRKGFVEGAPLVTHKRGHKVLYETARPVFHKKRWNETPSRSYSESVRDRYNASDLDRIFDKSAS